MSKNNRKKMSTNEANMKLNARFNNDSERFPSGVISNPNEANQEIQEQFYEGTEEEKIIYSPFMSQ
ncbi:hypothetical protein [Pseudoneobacillus sp. C159]